MKIPFGPLVVAAVCASAPLSAQEDHASRLATAPGELAATVVELVRSAEAIGVPAKPLTDLALEGLAKGHAPADVARAVEALARDMGRARSALAEAGAPVTPVQVESATMAIRMGVDGREIADIASAQGGGEGLSVALLVLGELVERGVGSDQALAMARATLSGRMEGGAAGPNPSATLGPATTGVGSSMNPATPTSGVTVPATPPAGTYVPGRGRGRSGRGGG